MLSHGRLMLPEIRGGAVSTLAQQWLQFPVYALRMCVRLRVHMHVEARGPCWLSPAFPT